MEELTPGLKALRGKAMTSQLESFQAFQQSLLDFGEALTTTLTPTLEAFAESARQFYAICWRIYRAAGMPYGESDEGMIRWLKERAMAEQMLLRAEAIMAHHRTLAMLRERIT